MSQSMIDRIRWMNRTFFEIETSLVLIDLGEERVDDFQGILYDEISELCDVCDEKLYDENTVRLPGSNVDLTKLADNLADVIVFAMSEAEKWGIPIVEVFGLVMDSQATKLEDGQVIWNHDRSKFLKGKYFQSPEPMIKKLLLERMPGAKPVAEPPAPGYSFKFAGT